MKCFAPINLSAYDFGLEILDHFSERVLGYHHDGVLGDQDGVHELLHLQVVGFRIGEYLAHKIYRALHLE
jgi:hypothetical protein